METNAHYTKVNMEVKKIPVDIKEKEDQVDPLKDLDFKIKVP